MIVEIPEKPPADNLFGSKKKAVELAIINDPTTSPILVTNKFFISNFPT